MLNILLIIIVVILLLLLFCNIQRYEYMNNYEDKCENVVYDPETLKRIPITSEKGDKLFKYKLVYYLNKYLKNTPLFSFFILTFFFYLV